MSGQCGLHRPRRAGLHQPASRRPGAAAALLAEIEAENAHDLTPERLAAMEAEQARAEALDEEASPTAGRRFTRA